MYIKVSKNNKNEKLKKKENCFPHKIDKNCFENLENFIISWTFLLFKKKRRKLGKLIFPSCTNSIIERSFSAMLDWLVYMVFLHNKMCNKKEFNIFQFVFFFVYTFHSMFFHFQVDWRIFQIKEIIFFFVHEHEVLYYFSLFNWFSFWKWFSFRICENFFSFFVKN